MPDIQKLVNYTREMRLHQKAYFRLAGMARKNPQYWDDARHELTKSKQFEIDVDHMLNELEKEVSND